MRQSGSKAFELPVLSEYWIFAYLWLAGMLISGMLLAIHNIRFRRKLKHSSFPADAGMAGIAEECRKLMEVRAEIPVVMTGEVKVPCLYGVINPCILIPCGINEFEGYMLVVHDPARIKTGFSSKLPKEGGTTSSIAKGMNAVAAINAGGFTDDGSAGMGGKPDGLVMHEGKVVYNNGDGNNDRINFVGFDSKGRMLVGTYTLKELEEMDAREGVSFGPALVVNGNPVSLNGDGGMGIAPRTAIGQKSDGSVLMLVIDGRSLKSIGASLKDVQDVMLKFDAVNAANLDGGSSSTMYYNGEVINKPSNSEGERLVPTAFLVEAQ